MKIAMIGMSPVLGGVETFIINTYRSLKRIDSNIQFYFISSNETICYSKEILSNNDYILKYPSRKKNIIKHYSAIRKIFSENKFDIIWCNQCSLSNIIELKMAYKYNVPIRIIHSHNSKNMGSSITLALHEFHKILVSKYANRYFSCSDLASKWMFTKKILNKVLIVNNSVDTNVFFYDVKNSMLSKEKFNVSNKLVIGHVGRFHTQKNHDYLIDIFCELNKKEPKSVLILCGSGELEPIIKNKVYDLGLDQSVIFLGNQMNMQKVYSCFDVLCFPSLYEGLPFALIEAQAMGIPCLISNNISKSVEITENLISFMDLKKSKSEWASELISISNKNKRITKNEIINSGYDLDTNMKYLYKTIIKS